jgi:hypothetical protein
MIVPVLRILPTTPTLIDVQLLEVVVTILPTIVPTIGVAVVVMMYIVVIVNPFVIGTHAIQLPMTIILPIIVIVLITPITPIQMIVIIHHIIVVLTTPIVVVEVEDMVVTVVVVVEIKVDGITILLPAILLQHLLKLIKLLFQLHLCHFQTLLHFLIKLFRMLIPNLVHIDL